MARLTSITGLSVLTVFALCMTTGDLFAASSRIKRCYMDKRFDPPRRICIKPDVKFQHKHHHHHRRGYWETGGRGGSGGSASTAVNLQPVRALITPSEMPPKGVAAYGIVAFTTLPLTEDRQRFLDVCSAYRSSLVSQSDLAGVPLNQQMVTFWPVKERTSEGDKDTTCDEMVASYDLKAALDAIRDADQDKQGLAKRRGPYLIAWSPSNSRALPDSVILVIDMSALGSPKSFQETFLAWRQKVIDDPKFWRNGFDLEQLRQVLRDSLDRYGAVLVSFLPGK